MFTTQFKVTIATLFSLAVVGGLLANQISLNNRLQTDEQKPVEPKVVVVTPTIVPTATPTATLRYVPKSVVPTKVLLK